MEVSLFYGIVDSVNTTPIIEQLVVDRHVVIKEVELSISGLLHVHLGHPVVGEVQGNVTTGGKNINTVQLSKIFHMPRDEGSSLCGKFAKKKNTKPKIEN